MIPAMTLDLKVIGGRIKAARVRAGLTQDQLAVKLHISMRQLQNYEHGVSKPFAKLHEIAHHTGVSESVFLVNEGELEEQLARLELELNGLRQLHQHVNKLQQEILRELRRTSAKRRRKGNDAAVG